MGVGVSERQHRVWMSANWADVEILQNRNCDDQLEECDENQHAHFAVALHLGYLTSLLEKGLTLLTFSGQKPGTKHYGLRLATRK